MLEISFYTCVPKTTIIWGMVSETEWDRQILSFWAIFWPFNPQTTQKIKILKNENAYEDVIILYMCTKNHNHMVYTSWDMGSTHNFLSFWVIFCPFTPLWASKIKNWKKIRRYFLLRMRKINKDSWDIRRAYRNFCHFGSFFALLSN